MAFKYKIAALTEVAEAVRGMYRQEGDAYVLDVEGVVPRERLDEFRNNNVALQQQLDKFKGVDPAKHAELMELQRKLQEKELLEAGEVDKVVQLRVQTMKDGYESQIGTLTTTLTKSTEQLNMLLIENVVRAEAVRQGAAPTAIDDLVFRARALYRIEEGVPVPKQGDKVVYGKDGQNPMPISEWVTGLKPTAPHLFAKSSGSGAGGGAGGGGAQQGNLSPLEKIQAGLANMGGEGGFKTP